ncbi:MAG TPA: ribbon-helix-helix protein, CopG family [Polyangiaceae bacterium]|nr:ribbon-helix-helix protein, CopG family [Polyangiaceae bacterium]
MEVLDEACVLDGSTEPVRAPASLDHPNRVAPSTRLAYTTCMALSAAKRTTTLILDTDTDRLLDIAAREQGVSRSEFIRAQLRRVLEQYKDHPKPRSAGAMRRRGPRDEEKVLFKRLEP